MFAEQMGSGAVIPVVLVASDETRRGAIIIIV